MAVTRRRARVAALVAVALVALVAACSSTTPADDATGTTAGTAPASSVRSGPPLVVVSTPLVGALVRSVGGDEVDLLVTMPPGIDPTTPVGDLHAVLAEAALAVVVDPRTYETGAASWADDDTATPETLVLAPQLNPIPAGGSELEPGSSDAGGETDPHVWLDPDRWTQAARLVGEALVEIDGVDPAAIQANVAAFDDAVSLADERLQATFATVPDDRRALVTDLAGLGYVADRYGFDLLFATDPATLATAAAERGATVVFTAPDRVAPLTAALAGIDPGLAVVGLDREGASIAEVAAGTEGATTAYVDLLVGTGDTIAAAVVG